MTIGKRLHYRHAASCRRRAFDRIQRRKPGEVKWLPSWQTYRLFLAIGALA